MIPALATCLFVIYLYKQLKAEEAGPSTDRPDSSGVEQRIAALRSRIESLADAPTDGRDAP